MPIKKIMIVDDDVEIRQTYKEILEISGFEVVTVENGVECGIKLAEERPQLLILDLLMPEMGGLRVIKYLIKNPDNKALYYIVISGHLGTEEKSILDGYQVPWLVKPVDPQDLVKKIKEIAQSLPPAMKS